MFFRSLSIVVSGSFMSRVLGFGREVVLSHFYGASLLTDMFILATRLPTLFRRLIEAGFLNATFIPIYGRMVTGAGPTIGLPANSTSLQPGLEARQYAGAILFYVLLAVAAIVAVVEIFMPQIISGVVAPGFKDQAANLNQIIFLSRISLPYLIFLGCAAVFTCILTAHQFFMGMSLAPAATNIVLIGALLIFAREYTESILYLVLAFLLSGLVHLSIVATETRLRNLWPDFRNLRPTSKVRSTMQNSIPTALTSGVQNINSLISTLLASLLPLGSISILAYTDRLVQLPFGVIGVSLYAVLTPSYSKIRKLISLESKTEQRLERFEKLQTQSIHVALAFSLPCVVAFLTLAVPISSAIYVHGSFSAQSGLAVASLMQISAFGLPSMIMLPMLIAYHHAEQRYKQILIFSVITVFCNATIAVLTIDILKIKALPLASVISSWLYFVLLWLILPTQLRRNFINIVFSTTFRLLPALIALAVMCYFAEAMLVDLHDARLLISLALFAVVAAGAFLAYALHVLGIQPWKKNLADDSASDNI